jgi:hypothetical protein
MDYLTTGTLLRERGIALIALGTFLVSLAWHLLRNADKARGFLAAMRLSVSFWLSDTLVFLAAVVCMIAGTRLVGQGGALTTQGWNVVGKHDARIESLAALAREWVANDHLRKVAPFVIPADDPNFAKGPYLSPRFAAMESKEIVTSGLFKAEAADKRLRLIAFAYELAVQHFNDYAEWMDWSVSHIGMGQPERLAQYRSLKESTRVKDFDRIHSRLYSYLASQYPDILSAAQQDFQVISSDRGTKSEQPTESHSEAIDWFLLHDTGREPRTESQSFAVQARASRP